jgi:dolichol kinase
MLYFLPTSIIMVGYCVITLFYTVNNMKEKKRNKVFINEVAISILFLFAGLSFPFLYQFHSPELTLETLNLLWLWNSIIFSLEMIIWAGILTYNTRISKRNSELMKMRDYNEYKKKVLDKWVEDLKSELGRKILHIFTGSVIFICWTIGILLNAVGFLRIVKLDVYSFSYWWIITIGFAFVIMFQIADLARLNRAYMLPNWARKWYLSMRPKELDTFIASTPLVLAFVPFIFPPFPIFAAVALITTVADGLACIVGKKYGTHPLGKNSKKTIEGFIAGSSSTFIIVVIVMILYNSWIEMDFFGIFIMAMVATLMFMIVDLFIKRISDNIMNPILTGLAMWIVYIIV